MVGKAKRAMSDDAMTIVESVVVDSHLRLPDMVEITFGRDAGTVVELSGLSIGAQVTVSARNAKGGQTGTLVVAEITAIEGIFDGEERTVVRGYSADHRLQRGRRTRTFVNMTLADVARKIAKDAGLQVGEVFPTRTAHDHLAQVNQTDWEFLSHHAAALGARIGVVDGKFVMTAGGPSVGSPVALRYLDNLSRFAPRLTAGNLVAEAEVRIWDPVTAKVSTAKAKTAATTRIGTDPGDLAAMFGQKLGAAARPPARSPAVDLGPAPSETAFVVSNRPLASGAAADAAAAEVAKGAAASLGDTFAEAEGEALGEPLLLAGAVAEVMGVSSVFNGKWTITRALHSFTSAGYRTRFEVSGSQDRSLLGLTARGVAQQSTSTIPGVVCGLVTNNNDPVKKGRVKIALPWLSPAYESDWAPVVQPGAGSSSGIVMLPEVGDEVLVGFEFGNPQRAYVIGGMRTDQSRYTVGGEPVMAKGETAAVVWRGLTTPSGNRLAFHDEMPPGAGKQPPTASEVVLGTAGANMALAIDQVAGTVTLSCRPAPPNSKSAKGTLTIECGDAGVIDIKAGAGGMVNIDGGARLSMRAQAGIKIESQGVVEIKGTQVKIN
jgi:phage protein D